MNDHDTESRIRALLDALWKDPRVGESTEADSAGRFIAMAVRGMAMRAHADEHHPGEVGMIEELCLRACAPEEREGWAYGYRFVFEPTSSPAPPPSPPGDSGP